MIPPMSGPVSWFRSLRDRSAALLGARVHHAWKRRAWFLAGSAALFVASWFAPPAAALGVLAVALWLLLAVSLAWGANEKLRGRIAKKIDKIEPDSLPDLRDLALLCALAVACFLPLLLKKAQDCFAVFELTREPRWWSWPWFLFSKTYLRALPDVVDLGFTRFEGLQQGGGIAYLSGWAGLPGHGLMLLAYGLLYLVLLQGLVRIWQVSRDVEEGIAGVAGDPDMAVRLGRRAVGPLLAAWQEPDLPLETRANIVTALGRIGDPTALTVLREAVRHKEPEVREAGLRALGELDNPETAGILGKVLLNRAETVGARATAAVALGGLTCPEAAAPLLAKLEEVHQVERRYREPPRVRKEVIGAVGSHLGARRRRGEDVAALIDRAVRLLLADEKNSSLLEDVYLRVRNRTAGALALLGDARAVRPLAERLGDPQYQNPKLVQDTALALGRLMQTLRESGTEVPADDRAAAVAELARQWKESPNDSVRQAAARALGMCGAVERKEELIAAFRAALKAGQEDLAEALKEGVCAIDPAQAEHLTDLEKRTGRLWSQRRRHALLDGERDLDERLSAARELGEYRDTWGLKALRLTAGSPDTPAELRAACAEAIGQIEAGRD
jgi:HEAT repeat protein